MYLFFSNWTGTLYLKYQSSSKLLKLEEMLVFAEIFPMFG